MKAPSKYGICLLSVIPCRKQPSHRSEQVSQLLFGESFKVIDKRDDWLFVKNNFDDYESWVQKSQVVFITEQEFAFLDKEIHVSSELIQLITNQSISLSFPISIGSSIPNKSKFTVAQNNFVLESQALPFYKRSRSEIIDTAFLFLNTPYQWGGRSAFGIDCSGFTQLVYKVNGIKLPRDAYQQAEKGAVIGFIEEAEPGDLAFFDNKEGKIIHVGILLADNKIIHASGRVRIDSFDHNGIYDLENKTYTHNLRIIKKII